MDNKKPKRRRSIRLKGYDYSREGAYFVTICVQDRLHLFGEITDDKSVLNVAGMMVEKWWAKLPEKFRTIVLDQYIIMPSHMHGIIIIHEPPGFDNQTNPTPATAFDKQTNPSVGANPCVRPISCVRPHPNPCVRPVNKQSGGDIDKGKHTGDNMGRHMGLPQQGLPQKNFPKQGLPQQMQWFKTMTTNEYIRNVKNAGWKPFNKRFWQRNYYEHIIRNENSLNRIREYIITNPLQWQYDRENPDHIEDKDYDREWEDIENMVYGKITS